MKNFYSNPEKNTKIGNPKTGELFERNTEYIHDLPEEDIGYGYQNILDEIYNKLGLSPEDIPPELLFRLKGLVNGISHNHNHTMRDTYPTMMQHDLQDLRFERLQQILDVLDTMEDVSMSPSQIAHSESEELPFNELAEKISSRRF